MITTARSRIGLVVFACLGFGLIDGLGRRGILEAQTVPHGGAGSRGAVGSAHATLTVRDAVEMVRVQRYTAADGGVAAISPDGLKAAAVTWHSDVDRNVNVYSLIIVGIRNAGRSGRLPESVLTWDLPGDPNDQSATPFSHLTFLGDNRTLAFLGREKNKPEQAYTVDTVTRAVRQLTREATPVRSFVVDQNGTLRAFSRAVAPDGAARRARIDTDGVFLSDRSLFPIRLPFRAAMAPLLSGDRQIRQYILASGDKPSVFFDSRQSRPDNSIGVEDPDAAFIPLTLEDDIALRGASTFLGNAPGRYAVLFPYARTGHSMRPEEYSYYQKLSSYARRIAAPYGLVDLANGHIEPLIDAPGPQSGGNPLWVPDGESVIIETLLPTERSAPPRWVEVKIAGRRLSPLPIAPGWTPHAWSDTGHELLLKNGDRFATLRRLGEGRWSELTERGDCEGFNPGWPVASNGHVAVGVVSALSDPPELAICDLATRRMATVSNFNPVLRTRRYGTVERFGWRTEREEEAFGFLVRPVDYKPGVRYPVVILLDDGALPREGRPFLLDADPQMSGHPIQMFAAEGMMVLYTKEPRLVFEPPGDGVRMREHIEGAVNALDRRGLIDSRRIGISGWSRAAYHVDYLLIHSTIPFAAASMLDGGAEEYNDGLRPFRDAELEKIRTPLLFEAYGPATLALHAAMADRLAAMGKQTEILYFATATHIMTQPQHRVRSLGTQLDWFRFWLLDQEDADASKRDQYVHWRRLRELRLAEQLPMNTKGMASLVSSVPGTTHSKPTLSERTGLP